MRDDFIFTDINRIIIYIINNLHADINILLFHNYFMSFYNFIFILFLALHISIKVSTYVLATRLLRLITVPR